MCLSSDHTHPNACPTGLLNIFAIFMLRKILSSQEIPYLPSLHLDAPPVLTQKDTKSSPCVAIFKTQLQRDLRCHQFQFSKACLLSDENRNRSMGRLENKHVALFSLLSVFWFHPTFRSTNEFLL